MPENKDFGLFLKEELTKKTNLNVSQVASILKCSRSTLNDLFNGKRQLSKAFAKRIEEALSSNSLSSSYSIKADDLLKKQAALIYGISEDHSNLKDDINSSPSLDEVNCESSREPSGVKYFLSNNASSIQDQGIPFFAKFTTQKIESYVNNNQQDCRGLIPEFVYTLIATTASNDYLEKFYLPYGDDISLKGFDGIVSYSQNHPYIPKGLSVWEIGTNKDPKRKFDEDFSKAKEKLSKLSQDVDIHDVTYVAVFPRTISYQNKENWIRQKKKEGSEFKDIRIIDAFLLAQWANQSVSAQLHFSKQFSNFEEDDLLTNIETSQFMYKEMCFDRIEHGEELLNDLFSLYQNDYYDLFKSFIRTGLDGNILKAASESKILTKAFICYLAKIYDSDDKNIKSDNTVNAIEYQINAALQYSEDKKQAKDTEFYGYEKSKYTNLFLNTYYIKDYKLLTKLISSLNVKSILIVDEEIIDFKIRELCRENQNIRIVAIRNSFPFDIMDSQDKAPSLVDELGFEDFFANSKKPLEEIELNPLPHYEIENTLTGFISRELKNRENKEGSHTNNSQAEHLDLNKFSHDKIRTLSYLSDGSLLNIKEILSNKGGATSSRLFIQQLKEQDINLNFLFCFCLMGKVNLDDETKFDVSVFKELLKDVVSPDTDIETELNKIVNLKFHKGIARFHNRCFFTTARYVTLNKLYQNTPINKKTIIQNLYAVVISLLKLKSRNGFVTSMFLDRNEFDETVYKSISSSVNGNINLKSCNDVNDDCNRDFSVKFDNRKKASVFGFGDISLDREELSLRENIKKTYKNLVNNILENFNLHNYNLPLTAQNLSYDLRVTDGCTLLLKNLLDAICFFTKANDMNVELQIYKYNSYLFMELKLDLSNCKESKQDPSQIQKCIKQAGSYGNENLKFNVDATRFNTSYTIYTDSKKTTKRENKLQVNEASDNNSFNKNDDIDKKVFVKDETSVQEKSYLDDEFFKQFEQLIGIAQCSEHLTIIDRESYFNFIQNEIPFFIEKAKSNARYNCYVEDHPIYSSNVLYSILYIAQISLNSDFNKKDFKLSLELLLKLKDSEKDFCHHNVRTWIDSIFYEIFNIRTFKNKQGVDLRCKVLKDNLKIYPDTCKVILQKGIYNCIQGTGSYARPYSVWFSFGKRYSVSKELYEYAVNSLLSVYLELVKKSLNTVIEKFKIQGTLGQEVLQENENLTVLNLQTSLRRNFALVPNDITANDEVFFSNTEINIDRYLDKTVNRDDFRTIICCIPYLTKDSQDAVLDLVKDIAKNSSEDYKLEILNLFEKEESYEQEKIKKSNNDDVNKEQSNIQGSLSSLSTFYNSVRGILEIKSEYLKNKWLIESCNSRGLSFEDKVPLKLKQKYQDRDSLYKYLRKAKSNYINKILKKDGPRAIAWIIKNCSFVLEYGENLISDLNLSVEGREQLVRFFVEEILINSDELSFKQKLLSRLLAQNKLENSSQIIAEDHNDCNKKDGKESYSRSSSNNDHLQTISSGIFEIAENTQNEINAIQKYLDNCKYLLSYLSSIDDGFMLDRAYDDLLRKRKLTEKQRISVLLNLPFIETVFNLVDKDQPIANEFWSKIKIAIPSQFFQNKRLMSRLQSSFTKVDRLIDFTYSCYFDLREHPTDISVMKLACDCTKAIIKKLDDVYTEEFFKTDINQFNLIEGNAKEKNELFKEGAYITNKYTSVYRGVLEKFIAHRKYSISSYERKNLFFMKRGIFEYLNSNLTMFTEDLLFIAINSNMSSYEEKVIIELYLLPYICNNNDRNNRLAVLTKEINYFFSVNPKEFFNFFCIDFGQNYYDKFTGYYFKSADFKGNEKDSKENNNLENVNNNLLKLNCIYFTDKIFELIYPIPGFCIGQKPNYKDIKIWIEDIIQTAKSTHNNEVLISTEYKLAETLTKQNRGSNNIIPHIEICKAIEKIEDVGFVKIFKVECFNSYSLNHITGYDGGKTNKKNANEFNDLLIDINEDEYPRTYEMIKSIIDSYLTISKEENEENVLRKYNG